MARTKQKYYSLHKIITEHSSCNWIILLGERSNGKSYAVKHHCIKEALEGKGEFIYLRRYALETKTGDVEDYFGDVDIDSLTNGEYSSVVAERGKIFLRKLDLETMEYEKGKKLLIGHYTNIAQSYHKKSNASYENVINTIFEEFVTDGQYLENEPRKLMQFISTAYRRRAGRVFLIGNTISRVCPYYSEWSLDRIPDQRPSTIDEYHFKTDQVDDDGEPIVVKIAVEFCENSGNNSKMFFGKAAEAITGAVWETKEYPRLVEPYTRYMCLYTFYIEYNNFNFRVDLLQSVADPNSRTLYIYPRSKKKEYKDTDRVISSRYNPSRYWSPVLYEGSKSEMEVRRLLTLGKVAYCNNLTGSDFEVIMLNWKRFSKLL